MAIWQRLTGFFTGAGNRQPGSQSGEASTRTQKSASPVNIDTALQLSAVWACAKLITETIASLPIRISQIDPATGRLTPLPDHPLTKLFAGKVNRWQTLNEYLETTGYQEVIQGNSYSAIQRNGSGDIISLIPLMTGQMTPRLLDDGTVIYEYLEKGTMRVFAQESILHHKGFGNGIVGLSPLSYGRNTIGVAQATENAVSEMYSNGGKPAGLLMIDKILKQDQREAIRRNFKEMSEGDDSRLFILEADMKYEKISMTPNDIQMMDGRRYNVEDIARFFGVPSVLINDTSQTTAWGTGVEQIIQGFFKLNLRPAMKRKANAMRVALLKPADRVTTQIAFDFDELIQPTFADRVKTAKEAVTGALMTPNQFRKGEGWEPVDGGDKLYMQHQMVPIDMLDKIPRGTTNDRTQQQDQTQSG